MFLQKNVHMECIILKFNATVEILKSSTTYNFALQKSVCVCVSVCVCRGGGMLPRPSSFCGPEIGIIFVFIE